MAPAIRLCRPNDAPALASLARDTFLQAFGHLYKPQDSEAYMATVYSPALQAMEIADSAHRLWVAEEHGALLGYLKAGPCKLPVANMPAPPLPGAMEIHRIYLLQSAQGKGLGRALMDTALEWMAQAPEIYIGVWEKNLQAQQFYAAYGFTCIGDYIFPVGTQLDRELILRR